MRRGVWLVFLIVWGGVAIGVAEAARLNVFVNVEHPMRRDAGFVVKELRLGGSEGTDVPLELEKPKVSTKAPFGQSLLTSAEVPEGRYSAVSLKLSEIYIGEKRISQERGIGISVNLELKEGESRCLFLVWDVQGSQREDGFVPSLYALPQRRPLRGETVYVTCDGINTLFAIRTDRNRVVASLATKATPRQLVALPRGDRLYVLCEESRSLLSVEMSTFRVIDSLLLPMVQRPRFLTLIDRGIVAITDPTNDQIFLVDATTGRLVKSKRLGHHPSDLFFWTRGRSLFVSSTGEQKVYQLNEDLITERVYHTGSSPRGIWVERERLYVADQRSGTISVFDLRQGRLVGRLRCGPRPMKIFGVRSRLYITDAQQGILSFLWPGQMSISKRIKIGGAFYEVVACKKRGWLYIVDRKEKRIVVVDALSFKEKGSIELGGVPFGLAVGA